MNKQKLPGLIPILILTLVTVVMWVGLEIYMAVKKPADSTVPVNVSQPLTPTLDQNTIKQVESQTFLDNSQIPNNIIVAASPTPIEKPTPSATPVAQPTNQPANASGSATTKP